MKTIDYRKGLLKHLKSRRYAAKLLQSAFVESCDDGNWRAFGLILEDVIDAQGNKKAFAKKAKISRQHLYRLLRGDANPTIGTLVPVLSTLGISLELKAG